MEIIGWAVRRPLHRRFCTEVIGARLPEAEKVESLPLGELADLAKRSPREQTLWRRMGRRAQKLWAADTYSVEDSIAFMESAASTGYTDAELMYNFGAMASKCNAEQASRALKVYADVMFSNPHACEELKEALDGGSTSAVVRGTWSLCSLTERGHWKEPPIDLLECIPVQQLSSHDAVTYIHAHYLVRHANIPALRDALRQLKLEEISPEDMTLIAKALAKLRVPSDSFFHDMAQHLQKPGVLSGLTAGQIVDLTYAYGKFSQIATNSAMLFDLFATEARKKFQSFTIGELAQLLCSFARAQITPKIVLTRTQSRLKTEDWWIDSKFEDVINLAMAFGRFQIHDKKLVEKLSTALIYHFTEGTRDPSSFVANDLINIIHAFAKVQLRPTSELLAILVRELEARIDEITTDEIVKYLHAAGKIQLNCELTGLLVNKLDEIAVSHLSIFDALKVNLALQKLDGIQSETLEKHLAEVLPYDMRVENRQLTASRRPREPQSKRQSARKRKWTW